MLQRPAVERVASHAKAGPHLHQQSEDDVDQHDAAAECDFRLTLPAHARSVSLARHVVGALAEGLGLPRGVVDNVRLAVTEACTNVVRHAYADAHAEGPLEVRVEPGRECLTVVVADRGVGIRANTGNRGAGLGLPLIAALTSELEIEPGPGQGSRVRMSFRLGGTVGAA